MEEKQPALIEIELDVEELEYEDYEDYEDYNEYDEEEDDYAHEARIAWDVWQLPNDLCLPEEAAAMYLLYDMYLDGKDEGKFQVQLDRLIKLFTSYTDMVVGGELRYACSQVSNMQEHLHPSLVNRLANTYMGGGERHEAWEEWAAFREKFGTSALLWAEQAFNIFMGSNAYGGVKWAHIAKTLRKFEEGEYSALLFVDMCWGTEHNGGQFFGKLWNTSGIKPVLDANQREDMDRLLEFASPSIQKFYVGAQ